MRGPKLGKRHLLGPAVGGQHSAMMAEPAAHRERPDALGAHVRQRHRRATVWCWRHVGLASWSPGSAGPPPDLDALILSRPENG